MKGCTRIRLRMVIDELICMGCTYLYIVFNARRRTLKLLAANPWYLVFAGYLYTDLVNYPKRIAAPDSCPTNGDPKITLLGGISFFYSDSGLQCKKLKGSVV